MDLHNIVNDASIINRHINNTDDTEADTKPNIVHTTTDNSRNRPELRGVKECIFANVKLVRVEYFADILQ